MIIIRASAALTDSFPLPRKKKKRADHTSPSISVHHFGALTGARARALVVRNARVLGRYAWQTVAAACVAADVWLVLVPSWTRNESSVKQDGSKGAVPRCRYDGDLCTF